MSLEAHTARARTGGGIFKAGASLVLMVSAVVFLLMVGAIAAELLLAIVRAYS